MTAEVRRVGRGDGALFERVAACVFDHDVDAEVLARYLAEPGHLLVVARAGGEIVGQAAGIVHLHPDGRPTELYVDEVGVAPAYRRAGVARQMLDELFAWGREHGCREAWVGTEAGNAAATALYESRGAAPEPFVMYVYEL